jgi:hypothetical protein
VNNYVNDGTGDMNSLSSKNEASDSGSVTSTKTKQLKIKGQPCHYANKSIDNGDDSDIGSLTQLCEEFGVDEESKKSESARDNNKRRLAHDFKLLSQSADAVNHHNINSIARFSQRRARFNIYKDEA